MKKVIFLSILCFLQIVKAEKRIFQAPFLETAYEGDFQFQTELLIPPLVSSETFKSVLAKDCDNFYETLTKYGSQLDFSELSELVKLPVAYSMKNDFEVEVQLRSQLSLSLPDTSELQLRFEGKGTPEVDLAGNDLFQGKADAKDSLALLQIGGSTQIKFLRRDLFCQFLRGNMSMKLSYQASLKPNRTQSEVLAENFNTFSENLRPLLESSSIDRQKAAMIGFKLAQALKKSPLPVDSPFYSVGYLWDVIFKNENSMEKSILWNLDLKNAFFPQSPILIKIKGVL